MRRDLLSICLPLLERYPAHDCWQVHIADGMGHKRIVPEVLQYYQHHGSNESQWVVNRTSCQTAMGLKIEGWQKRLYSCFVRNLTVTKASGKDEVNKNRLLLDWAQNALEHAPADLAWGLHLLTRELEVICSSQEELVPGRLARAEIRQRLFRRG